MSEHALELSEPERALIKQWREQGRQRTIDGVTETLVCLGRGVATERRRRQRRGQR